MCLGVSPCFNAQVEGLEILGNPRKIGGVEGNSSQALEVQVERFERTKNCNHPQPMYFCDSEEAGLKSKNRRCLEFCSLFRKKKLNF